MTYTDYTLLEAGLLMLEDACPPEPRCYLCRHGEDPETACAECWRQYLYWVAGGCLRAPYAADLARDVV